MIALSVTAVICSAFALFMLAEHFLAELLDQPSDLKKERRLQPRTAEQMKAKLQLSLVATQYKLYDLTGLRVSKVVPFICGYQPGLKVTFTVKVNGYLKKSVTISAASEPLTHVAAKMLVAAKATTTYWNY